MVEIIEEQFARVIRSNERANNSMGGEKTNWKKVKIIQSFVHSFVKKAVARKILKSFCSKVKIDLIF